MRSDNAGVVIGWAKGAKWCAETDLATAWARVWVMHEELQQRNVIIKVVEIKGHIQDHEVEAGHWTPPEQYGNEHADRLAREAADKFFVCLASKEKCSMLASGKTMSIR